jgi:hypothetical protein
MGLRVWERGKSECRSVIERIEVERNRVQEQHYLRRKQADFHLVSGNERV